MSGGRYQKDLYAPYICKQEYFLWVRSLFFDGYVLNYTVDGLSVERWVWDSLFGESDEHGRIRLLPYPYSDVFILRLDLADLKRSHMDEYWVNEELRVHKSDTTIVLFATKKSAWRTESLATKIRVTGYLEISSFKMEGLDDVYHHICVVGMNEKRTYKANG